MSYTTDQQDQQNDKSKIIEPNVTAMEPFADEMKRRTSSRDRRITPCVDSTTCRGERDSHYTLHVNPGLSHTGS